MRQDKSPPVSNPSLSGAPPTASESLLRKDSLNTSRRLLGYPELPVDQPNLGLATTRELLDEIRARIEVDGKLDYKTVDGNEVEHKKIELPDNLLNSFKKNSSVLGDAIRVRTGQQVPLVIYKDGLRVVIGKAVVKLDGTIEAFLKDEITDTDVSFDIRNAAGFSFKRAERSEQSQGHPEIDEYIKQNYGDLTAASWPPPEESDKLLNPHFRFSAQRPLPPVSVVTPDMSSMFTGTREEVIDWVGNNLHDDYLIHDRDLADTGSPLFPVKEYIQKYGQKEESAEFGLKDDNSETNIRVDP